MNTLFFLLFAFFLTGCATIANETTQSISLMVSSTEFMADTHCRVTNEEGTWQGKPNRTMSIRRDGNTMDITCENNKQTGTTRIDPDFSSSLLIADIGMIIPVGLIVDAATNSLYKYPGLINITLHDK
jgi:hypothetical protein